MKEMGREADLPTQQSEAVPQAWLPQANVHAGGSIGAEPQARQGTQAPIGLIVGVRDVVVWRSLSGKAAFSRVYEGGAKLVGRHFVLFLYPGDGQARAVVASRKVGGAVHRNRAKRLLREAIRSQVEEREGSGAELRRRCFPEAPPGEGIWLVAVARPSIVSVRGREVAAELAELLDRRKVDVRRGD